MLNSQQQEQIRKQIEAYESGIGQGVVEIPFGTGTIKLQFDPFVANPKIMNSGIQMSNYLVEHPELVKNKVVVDMGTGSGILGVVAGLLGAKRVFLVDIDPQAINNAQKNIKLHHLQNCEAFQGDLFNTYAARTKADLQIFNQPYFADQPITGKGWTRMMLGGTELLRRYFEEAPRFSTPNAIYLLSWMTLAEAQKGGVDNDPGKRAPAFGYRVMKITEQKPVKEGIQKSLFKVYELHR